MELWSRLWLEQILQISLSEILWQTEQCFSSFFILTRAEANASVSLSSCFKTCSTYRMAVFLPTPGSFANSLMTSSICLDEKFIVLIIPIAIGRNEFTNNKKTKTKIDICGCMTNLHSPFSFGEGWG